MIRDKIVTILAVLLFAETGLYAVPEKIFTSSGYIFPGDEYGIVRIYNDDTVVNMLGGSADYIATYDRSTLNVVYGQTQSEAFDYSLINIYGGTHSGVLASDNGIVNFSGDSVSWYLLASDFGVINMIGGTVEALGAAGSGTLNLYYGQVTDVLSVYDNAVVNIFGHDLGKTNVGGEYGYGQVYGFLLDDLPFVIDFYTPEAYSHTNLIPEPGTLLLLGLGGLILRQDFPSSKGSFLV